MNIDGVKNVQVNAYQTPQAQQTQQAKPVESVNVEPVAQAVTEPKVNTSENGAEEQVREYSNEQLKKTVADMNKKMQNTSCQYGIHEDTGRVTIKIVDRTTKNVIKEFPAEETLELIAKAWELAGIMVDEKL